MINSKIVDPSTGKAVNIFSERNSNYLGVKQVSCFDCKFYLDFFKDSDGSNAINQDAGYGGTPEVLYAENSGEPTEWTASAISGTWTFNSATVAHAGTVSISATATTNNDTMQLLNATITDLSGYVALTGWIYITSWSVVGTKNINIYGYNTATASIVGTIVNINNYVNVSSLNTWQKFSIPLSDMNLSGQSINAIRIATISSTGTTQDYYLDDIQLEETGSKSYWVKKPESFDKYVYISELNVFIADNMSGITTVTGSTENATLQNISYDKLMGLSALTNGINFQLINNSAVVFNYNFKQMSDFLNYPFLDSFITGGDGTNSWVRLRYRFDTPIVLRDYYTDYFRIETSEDLSSLLDFKVSVGGKEEI